MHTDIPLGEFISPKEYSPEFRLESPYGIIRSKKNIIFDLGGVIIDLDRNRAVEALTRLGLKNADELLGLYRQEEPFLGLETGHIEAGEFFDIIRLSCPGTSDMEITEAFDRFLIGIPPARLERLRALRKSGYRLYMLSNTNPVMYNGWITDAFRSEGLTVNDYFDGIVTSFQELICKPDPEIFSIVLKRYSLIPEDTIMLDDSEANCEAARSIGMTAIRVTAEPDGDMLAITAAGIERK